MLYTQPLPPIRKLKKLAEWDGPFPMKCYRLVIGAQRFGFDEDVIQFLNLFPHNAVFSTRDKFIQSCLELEQAIQAETEPQTDIAKNVSAPAKKDILHAAFRLMGNAKSAVTGLGMSARSETWYL